ncbi:MAG: hypothetical protein J1F35_02155 [Erysipelotrichales bacterium]|nr:hypothetical protein [Erysipelotrichales bacterium]
MDLTEVKISEIKNLGLIYVYSTDSVFTDEENKYLGIKVSYDNSKNFIQMDYKNPHFPSLVKKIISQYYKEKDNRNIILLGNLTNKFIEDDEIRRIAEERQKYQSEGLTLFGTRVEKLKAFEPYLKETIGFILKYLKRYDGVTIGEIDGYNKKFIVNYSIGSVNKQLQMIIGFIDDRTIDFRIGAINGEAIDIQGKITNNFNEVVVEWNNTSKNGNGIIVYDVNNAIVEKKVTISGEDLYHQTEGDTITNSDIELINFYLKLFGISWDKEFMKTGDNNFIFGYDNNDITKEEDALVINHGMQLFITDDEVVLKYVVRDSLKKYKNSFHVDLDEELCEITVKKVIIDNETHLLIEKTSGNSYGKKYDYVIYKTGNIDFKKPFEVEQEIKIDTEVKSIYDVIKRTKELTGGNN